MVLPPPIVTPPPLGPSLISSPNVSRGPFKSAWPRPERDDVTTLPSCPASCPVPHPPPRAAPASSSSSSRAVPAGAAAAMNGKGPFPAQPLFPAPAPPGYPQALPLLQPPPYPEPAYPELYRLSFVPLGAAGVPPVSPACPGASLYLPLAPPLPLPGLGSPVAFLPLGQVYPAGSPVLLEGGLDSAARLGTGGTASIQPPPAGCPAGAAPVPVPPGAAVLLPPRKGGFPGGPGGGFGLW
ncbi:DAZ-associated protein 2 [Molothrus ater]|uniref:DAZ-associated protein 2 n=2 Tax=Icteridae TaxID=164646 RepID=UPI0023E767A6|nr:DAZ-associated protein 2 [Molothrus ater]